MSYNYISKLDDETAKNLEAIYNYSYRKWVNGELKNRPSIVDVVKELINGLYEIMKEEGKFE
jgi:flagellin-specific chaperone FliS